MFRSQLGIFGRQLGVNWQFFREVHRECLFAQFSLKIKQKVRMDISPQHIHSNNNYTNKLINWNKSFLTATRLVSYELRQFHRLIFLWSMNNAIFYFSSSHNLIRSTYKLCVHLIAIFDAKFVFPFRCINVVDFHC